MVCRLVFVNDRALHLILNCQKLFYAFENLATCTYPKCFTSFWPHLSSYLVPWSHSFNAKLTFFDPYRAYNVFYLTFRSNSQVLIERKTLGTISRKNRCLTKPQRTKKNKIEEHTTVHYHTQLCCKPRSHARVAWPCMGLWPAMHRGTVVRPPTLHSRVTFCSF